MNSIVKICKVHGDLTITDVNKSVDKRYKSHPVTYICKKCQKEYQKNYVQNNKHKILVRRRAWREKTRERRNASRRHYYQTHIQKPKLLPNATAAEREHFNRFMDSQTLSDRYVKNCIANKFKISTKAIPRELIDAFRQIIKLKRLIKKKKSDESKTI